MARLRLFALLLSACFLSASLPAAVTVRDAERFMDKAEAHLLTLSVDSSRADWVRSTYITDDTEILAAEADERSISATTALVKESRHFDHLVLPPVLARKFKLLRLSLTLATPSTPAESEELTRIVSGMDGAYGKGKYCPQGQTTCLDLHD